MIKIIYRGRFGNNLFTYTYSRIMAERFNIELASDLPSGGYFKNTTNKKGNVYNTEPIFVSDIDNSNFISPDYSAPRTYLIEGYFQNISYYTDKNYIKTFFQIPDTTYNEEDVVMHVRLSDYSVFGELGTILHPNYYLKALSITNFKNLYIVTDDPNNEYLKNFRHLSPIIINDKPDQDFKFLMGFKKIIIGNSSFSWWAAYLGKASEVYTPSVWLRYCGHIKEINKLAGATIVDATWL